MGTNKINKGSVKTPIKTNIMKNNLKYIVWVDSIPNYFDNLLDAQIEQIHWINKGYDNILIENSINGKII